MAWLSPALHDEHHRRIAAALAGGGLGGGSGAPTGATYIVQTPDAGLSAEQALSVLGTGLVKNTTGTGVLSIAVAGTDYSAPGHTHAAGDITSGTMAQDRLGSGSAGLGAKFLADDQTWKTPTASGGETMDDILAAIEALT